MFQKLHEIVHLTCAVDTSVNPTPEFSIWVGHSDREDEMLIESSSGMSKLIYEHELELDDEGAFFYCKMIQMVRNSTSLVDILKPCGQRGGRRGGEIHEKP